MKKQSKFLSFTSIVLLLSIVTFVACKKDYSDARLSISQGNNTTIAELLANDADFKDYMVTFNEIQAQLVFFDKSKSQSERKLMFDELSELSRKRAELSQNEQQRIAELLGFPSFAEMTTAHKSLSAKKRKIEDKYPMLKEPNLPENNAIIKKAFAYIQKDLAWIIVCTKEDGVHAVNKRAWRNSLSDVSTVQARCCPTPWDHCSGSCENEASEGYLNCQFMGAMQNDPLFGYSDCEECAAQVTANYDLCRR